MTMNLIEVSLFLINLISQGLSTNSGFLLCLEMYLKITYDKEVDREAMSPHASHATLSWPCFISHQNQALFSFHIAFFHVTNYKYSTQKIDPA